MSTTVPVKRLNDGVTDYFPMSVLDSVFLNKSITANNTVGGVTKNSTLNKNISLQNVLEKILVTPGPDYEQLIANKVSKIDGKGLSTHDFNDDYKDQLDNLESDLEERFSNKVNIEPSKRLITFTEANKLRDLHNYDDTSIREEFDSALANKVSKESGKGLSETNFSAGEKFKLSNLHNYDDTYVRGELAKKFNRSDVLDRISELSTAPVQSKVLFAIIRNLQERLAYVEEVIESIQDRITYVTEAEVETPTTECEYINLVIDSPESEPSEESEES